MLNERPLRALRYDPATDEATLEVAKPGTTRSGKRRTVEGQLLLDAAGFLVGVDLGGEGPDRVVVMLGPHEKVDRTAPVKLVVEFDVAGDAAVLRVAGAKGAMRAGEKSPYPSTDGA
jgi:hypothetical protein